MPDRRFDVISPAPSGPRPGSANARAASVLATLAEAVDLARAQDYCGARHLCAAVVLDAQPLIAARKELLRATLHALLLAQGFKLLSRLAMAVSGRSIQVTVLPDARHGTLLAATEPIAPPHIRQGPRHMTYVLDPRWLAQLAPDDTFLQQWCDALLAHEPAGLRVPVAPEPAIRQLEPV